METKHVELKNEIESKLKEVLPANTFIVVYNTKSIFDNNQIVIKIAASSYQINNVSGQHIQLVSLLLDADTLEIHTQIFGGSGGGRIYRKPNMNDPKEKYLAMKGIKIPFRQPKKEKKFVVASIVRFAENWLKTLKENKDVLMYKEYFDYDSYFGS